MKINSSFGEFIVVIIHKVVNPCKWSIDLFNGCVLNNEYSEGFVTVDTLW